MWIKGQLHLHTNISDGNLSPNEVAKIYKNEGFDFIVFSDHRKNYSPNDYVTEKLDDFIMIPGMEWDASIKNMLGLNTSIHMNGIGFRGELAGDNIDNDVSKTLENMIKSAYKANAVPMVNHPNFAFAFNYRELLSIDVPYLLEIVNKHPLCFPYGTDSLESVEYTWDVLLTNGKNVYGTATDDAHEYQPERLLSMASYNRGWVMCNVSEFTQSSIVNSLICGDFYATTGITLKKYEVTNKGINIEINPVDNDQYIIIFKGRMGIPLKIVNETMATYEFTNSFDEEYIRVKIINTSGKVAYTQPIFQNGKKIKIEL